MILGMNNLSVFGTHVSYGATIYVAASDATVSEQMAAIASGGYICDGTNDDVQIQAAIATLGATGGTVVLSSGNFAWDTPVTLISNIEIKLNKGTVITVPNSTDADVSGLFYGNAVTNVTLKGGKINGNYANQASGSMQAIKINNSSNIKIRDMEIYGFTGAGIYVLGTSSDIFIYDNIIHDNGMVDVPKALANIILVDVTTAHIRNNKISGENHTVRADTSSYINIEGNTLTSTVNGNLWLSSAVVKSVINGNIMPQSGSRGITNGPTCHGNIISNNMIYNTGRDGVEVQAATGVVIIGNLFENNGTLDEASSANGVQMLNDANSCTVVGNKFKADGTKQRRGIYVATSDCDGNTISDNILTGTYVTAIISDLGTKTIVHHNQPIITKGEIRTYAGSLSADTVGNAVVAWQNPETSGWMVTVRTLITTGATAAATGDMGIATTVNVVEDCEDAWSAGTHGTSAVNTNYAERGTNCNAITITAGITNNDVVAYEDISSQDDSTATHLLFKFRSTVALNAGDVDILLDEDSACVSPSFHPNLPAIAANTTTLVCVAINGGAAAGATCDAIISVGLRVLSNTRAVAGTIFYIDDVRAITVGYDLVNDANLQTTGIANYTTPVYVGAKNSDDLDCIVMVSAAQATTDLVGSYYLTMQGT